MSPASAIDLLDDLGLVISSPPSCFLSRGTGRHNTCLLETGRRGKEEFGFSAAAQQMILVLKRPMKTSIFFAHGSVGQEVGPGLSWSPRCPLGSFSGLVAGLGSKVQDSSSDRTVPLRPFSKALLLVTSSGFPTAWSLVGGYRWPSRRA